MLVLLLSFLGCFAAMRDNRRMLIAYTVVVLLFVIIELAVGIAAYVRRDELTRALDPLWTRIRQADDKAIEDIERQFQCCGYNSLFDRAVPPYITSTPKTATCMTSHMENDQYTYTAGCSTAIHNYLIISGNQTAASKLQTDVWQGGGAEEDGVLVARLTTPSRRTNQARHGSRMQHQCCGYYLLTDPYPFGNISESGAWVSCTATHPSWVPCFYSLQTMFFAARDMHNVTGDLVLQTEQDEVRCALQPRRVFCRDSVS